MYLENYRKIVVKIGSSLIIDDKKKLEKNGYISLQKI